jgi:hypothetical protein
MQVKRWFVVLLVEPTPYCLKHRSRGVQGLREPPEEQENEERKFFFRIALEAGWLT